MMQQQQLMIEEIRNAIFKQGVQPFYPPYANNNNNNQDFQDDKNIERIVTEDQNTEKDHSVAFDDPRS